MNDPLQCVPQPSYATGIHDIIVGCLTGELSWGLEDDPY